MPQSSAIFFFVAAAFLVFITQRGELPAYLGFFYGKGGSAAPVNNSTGATPTAMGTTNAPGSPATTFSNWLTGTLGLPSWLPLN